MNIDDIADSVTRQDTPGEIFYPEWLSDLLAGQLLRCIQYSIV